MTRSRTVPAAIAGGAQVRAAFEHLAGNFYVGLAGIVAAFLSITARILRNAARLGRVGFMSGGPPIFGPFPDVADHVVNAVAVGRKGGHRRGARETVFVVIFVWKVTLPSVAHVAASGRELVAPGELGPLEAAARGKLPFRLGGQVLAGPLGVGFRVAIRNVHDRMVVEAGDRGARTVRAPPIGAE